MYTSGKEIEQFLGQLYKLTIKKYGSKNVGYNISQIITNMIKEGKSAIEIFFVEEMLKKILTDFYVYNLFKIERKKNIDKNVKKTLDDINILNSEKDVVDYILNHLNSLEYLISDYYEFHSHESSYISKVIANVINKSYEQEIFRLYNNFFNSYEGYYQYILSDNIKKGLAFIEEYKEKQTYSCISKFLNNEFDDSIERNHFISYILSNIYANLKINNISGEEINKLISLTEKLNFRMYCFYDNEKLLKYLFDSYYDLYQNYKWYDFIDIRDKISINNLETIKKLDSSYEHPTELIKDATDISSIDKYVEDDILSYLTLLINEGNEDDVIIEKLKDVVFGRTQIPNFLELDNNDFIVNFRALIVSKYYEYVNLNYDEMELADQELFDELDDDIDFISAINLFNDEENTQRLVEQFYNYLFIDYKTDYQAMHKIIDDDKLGKLFKMNPNCLLDYRKIFGYIFPTETIETVDFVNDLMSTINNIIATNYQAHVCSDNEIYNEIVQVLKLSCDDFQVTIYEMIGSIVCNIYERLKMKNKLTNEEKMFIKKLENDELDIDEIIDDDENFEQLIRIFEQHNEHYLDLNTMCKLRSNTKKRGKIKILEKYDPYYYLDKDCLDNKID